MSLGLAEYSYSRVLVCEIYSTQLILIMTSLGGERGPRPALAALGMVHARAIDIEERHQGDVEKLSKQTLARVSQQRVSKATA